jgi:glycosyltransferase involved in cell wall biosynthesis
MKASVLIVTNGHLCRNPRPLKEAFTLGKAGYDVTVLGIRNHAASDRQDAALAAEAPFKLCSVNLLPGAGWNSLLARLRIRLLRDLAKRGLGQSIGSLGPAKLLLRRARALNADLTICHNEIAHWVGLQLRPQGRRIAADLEDWHSEDLLPADRQARPLGLIRQVESALLRQCAYVTTTSQSLADGLHHRYGGAEPAVISNSFPLQDNPRTACTPDDGPIRFFWFSQTLGPGRGLEAFLRIWAQLELHSEVVLLGEDRGGYQQRLRALLPETKQASLQFRPLVTPDELPTVIAAHDIGLALEDSSIVNRDLTITNKILQYLNAGLAVLATPTAGQREVFAAQPEIGEFFDPLDPTQALAALRRIATDREQLRARQQAARRLAQDRYCWEREETKLLALVSRTLEPSSR